MFAPTVDHWGVCAVCLRLVRDDQNRSRLPDGTWAHMRCWHTLRLRAAA
jgi:hypothetical protein